MESTKQIPNSPAFNFIESIFSKENYQEQLPKEVQDSPLNFIRVSLLSLVKSEINQEVFSNDILWNQIASATLYLVWRQLISRFKSFEHTLPSNVLPSLAKRIDPAFVKINRDETGDYEPALEKAQVRIALNLDFTKLSSKVFSDWVYYQDYEEKSTSYDIINNSFTKKSFLHYIQKEQEEKPGIASSTDLFMSHMDYKNQKQVIFIETEGQYVRKILRFFRHSCQRFFKNCCYEQRRKLTSEQIKELRRSFPQASAFICQTANDWKMLKPSIVLFDYKFNKQNPYDILISDPRESFLNLMKENNSLPSDDQIQHLNEILLERYKQDAKKNEDLSVHELYGNSYSQISKKSKKSSSSPSSKDQEMIQDFQEETKKQENYVLMSLKEQSQEHLENLYNTEEDCNSQPMEDSDLYLNRKKKKKLPGEMIKQQTNTTNQNQSANDNLSNLN